MMRLKRIMPVKTKKEIRSEGLKIKNSGTCELCRSAADNLAELNHHEVCSHCFQQMIQNLIGGRRNDSVVKEIFVHNNHALDEDALMVT